MNTRPNILLFSVFTDSRTETTNQENHRLTLADLEAYSIPYTELNGTNNEKAIMLIGFDHVDLVEDYATKYESEGYFKSYGDRFIEFVSMTSTEVERLGYLVYATKEEAIQNGDFIHNPQTDDYFVIKAEK